MNELREPVDLSRAFNQIVEASEDKIYLVDYDLQFCYINPAYIRLAVELWGKEVKLFASPLDYTGNEEERSQLEGYLRQALAGNPVRVDTCLKNQHGASMYFAAVYTPLENSDGKISGVAVSLTNLTEQLLAGRDQTLLAALVESSEDAIISKTLDGTILTWNQGATNLYGFAAEEMIGGPVSRLIPPRQVDELPQILEKISQGEQNCHYETVRRRKDGEEIAISLAVSPIRDNQGKVIGASSIARDISRQKQAERELHRSQELFQTFMDNGPTMAWVFDYAGNIYYFNEPFYEQTGVSRDKGAGNNVAELFPQEAARQFIEYTREVIDTGKTTTVLETYHRTSGELRYVLSYRFPLAGQFGQQKLMGGIAIDITERVLAEKALSRREEEFRALVENSPDLVLRTDLDLQVLYANPAFIRFTRVAITRLLGKPAPSTSVHSGISDRLVGLKNRLLETGLPQDTELEFIAPDGTKTYFQYRMAPEFNAEGKLESLLVIARDLTELKKAQDKLLDRERFKTLFELSPDAVILADPTGRIISCNQALEVITGYPRMQLLGQLATDLGLIEHKQLGRLALQSSGLTEPITQEIAFTRVDQRQITIEIKLLTVKLNEQIHFICTVRDVSKHKELENELRLALEQQRELAELRVRFISTTSHEFRTPLTIIQTVGESLEMYLDKMSRHQVHDRIEKIKTQVSNVIRLLDDVLLYNQIQVGAKVYNPKPGDLVGFIRSAIQELREMDKGLHRLEIELPDQTVETEFDEVLMGQLISNLLSNGFKYSPRNSAIRLAMARQRDKIILQVTDQGIGIPEKDQVKIFEPFYRASNSDTFPGTGLGLSIVNDAVKLHGGNIGVRSKVGQGTTFVVSLPVTR